MSRAWMQVEQLAAKHTNSRIVIAGDLFHHWLQPAEMVNFIIDLLGSSSPVEIWALPGNHDLKNQRLSDLNKTPFWTLIKAGKIRLIPTGGSVALPDVVLHGFPHSVEVEANKNPHTLALNVAVVHKCIWTQKTGYTNAPEDCRLKAYKRKLRGYDAAVFGDNHIAFDHTFQYDDGTRCTVCNAGTLIRRRSDEKDYQPSVGLLRADGTVERHYLDVKSDKISSSSKRKKPAHESLQHNYDKFIAEMQKTADQGIDFEKAVRDWIRDHEVLAPVADILLQSIGPRK